jgi:hypothetical protein
MTNESTPSSGQGATQDAGSPATGTNASGSATQPAKPAITLEDALARIAELEHAHRNATEERDRHRKKLSSYEEQERKAQEAALSEVEKATKRATEAEQRIKQYQQQLVTAQVKLAAQSKGIIDPDLAALAIAGQLEYGDDGLPTNVDKALDDLLKTKPFLAKAQPTSTPAIPNPPVVPVIPAMNPGRSQLQQSGTRTRPPSLSEAFRLSDEQLRNR